MSTGFATSRRTALALGAAALVIGFTGRGTLAVAANAAAGDEILQAGTFVRVDSSGAVTVVVPYAEMGQGALTAIAMLVAEELEVDPTTIRTEMAPGDDKLYGHPILGEQLTGGSLSVQGAWKQMRQAGAAARIVLVTAAARAWSVEPAACRAEAGHVVHQPSGRRVAYGDLVESARAIPVPQDPRLKKRAFRVIGQPLHRLDAAEKVNGSAIYGIDVRMPGLRFAALMLSPTIG